MFGKKKVEIHDTSADLLVKKLSNEVIEASCRIGERVAKVIFRNGVIELYPEGADKKKAKADAETAKHLLLNAIAFYDDVANQYEKAIANENRKTTLNYRNCLMTSHEIVEKEYEYYMKKR